ncbi:MAG: hypothetical protein H0T84_02225 [Tatlockia sp.]|nr:hypothetical protein [Tatlockia sp.]
MQKKAELNNESLPYENTDENVTTNSVINKTQADYLLKKYNHDLGKAYNYITRWGGIRCSPADVIFIPILLQVLKAISNQEEKIIYKGYDLDGMSGLEAEINNKAPHDALNYLLRYNPNSESKDHFLIMSEHYFSTEPDLKYKADSFYFDILNPAEIHLESEIKVYYYHNKYKSEVDFERDQDESDFDYDYEAYSDSDLEPDEANGFLSSLDSSFFWQVVNFIDDNKRIIAGVLLGCLLLAGLAALTVGTCGFGLLGASAAAAVGVIGIAGTTAIATAAVGGGAALASAAGLAWLGFFPGTEKKTDEQNSSRIQPSQLI